MNLYRADLHIHTVLSPCAAREMTPPAIVAAAMGKGLAMIAICDHNSAGNVAAVQEAADGRLAVLAGVEIATVEEVHVLGIFPSAEAASDVAAQVMQGLPPADETYYEKFGEQSIVDATGVQRSREPKMLANASHFTLPLVVNLITAGGGLAIAAHVDRPSFSVSSQLGGFPKDVRLDAIEFSPAQPPGSDRRALVELGYPVVCSSDSHHLAEIGIASTGLRMERPTFGELAMCLRGEAGRAVVSSGESRA